MLTEAQQTPSQTRYVCIACGLWQPPPFQPLPGNTWLPLLVCGSCAVEPVWFLQGLVAIAAVTPIFLRQAEFNGQVVFHVFSPPGVCCASTWSVSPLDISSEPSVPRNDCLASSDTIRKCGKFVPQSTMWTLAVLQWKFSSLPAALLLFMEVLWGRVVHIYSSLPVAFPCSWTSRGHLKKEGKARCIFIDNYIYLTSFHVRQQLTRPASIREVLGEVWAACAFIYRPSTTGRGWKHWHKADSHGSLARSVIHL